MRAGPLSNAKVIDLLNHYYIPLVISNNDYNSTGSASAEEKRERHRIARESKMVEQAKPLSVSAASNAADIVCYIVTPTGDVHSTQRLPDCSVAEKVAAFLETAIKDLNVKPGKQVLPARPTLVPPSAGADQIVLHLTARYLAMNGNKRSATGGGEVTLDRWMALIGNRLRAVSALPSENWIILDKGDWTRLMAPVNAGEGTNWTLADDLVRKIYTPFYPPSTNNDPSQHQLVEKSLKATLVSVKDGTARVRLEGKVKAKHPFLGFADDDYHVEADVLGYVDYDVAKRQIKTVKLVSDKGTYAGGNFGIAIRSIQ